MLQVLLGPRRLSKWRVASYVARAASRNTVANRARALQTRAGRVFSPYGVIRPDFDASPLVEHALCDPSEGVDHWDLEPLTPLPSRSPSPTLPPHHSPPFNCSPHPPLGVATSQAGLSSSAAAPAVAGGRQARCSPQGAPANAGQRPNNRAKRGKAARRAAKRAAEKKDALSRNAPAPLAKHVERAAPLPVRVDISSLPIAKGGFVGVRQAGEQLIEGVKTLEELGEEGYACHDWDGRCV